jgi:CheY-like chemotaxis protein
MRILVVDNHADTADLLARVLRANGHAVRAAGTAADALAACAARPFDLLVSDVALPGVDGWELVRRVRGDRCAPRAIAVTAYGRGRDVDRSRRAGFDAHLTKPVDLPTLLRAIDAVAA